ncbi:acyl-CoA/acyl-ACP dehydrogenase (plasmid) [Roseomonas sp. OT10]|uniref:acyl-CoA dehydrogenase family protein n=1 Tax=Roseomonas cutis TaxID=2897332 RepID=UPI001E3A7BC4|nr:acyl-CoA dehydrogenase family protein [Roseomonas sp. OT10]UFN51535.1 acyl-CoA/acyl-ACP dehydrogenase [Roseomonas sp. OT10]
MDFALSETQRQLAETVGALMERHATRSYIRALDREGRYPLELYDAWAEAGLFALPFPEEHGGLGGTPLDLVVLAEAMSAKGFDFFTAYAAGVFCGLNILRHGTEAQRRDIVPAIISGVQRMAICVSEPDAGSDAAAMRTAAKWDGEAWRLNGRKLWSTGAGAPNTLLNVYARSDPQAPTRNAISLFLVPNSASGVELRKLDMLGRRCVGTYEITFDDVRVPPDALVGEPNAGWSYLLSGLRLERLCSAAGYCGSAQAVLDMAVTYAGERAQFGRPIGSNQALAHLLADMRVDVEAARLLTHRAAWALEQGGDALAEITMAKLFGSEAYVRAANAGMQVMGAYGYSMEFDMQRHFRDARSTTIGAGTSQMQRNLLAGLMGLKVG